MRPLRTKLLLNNILTIIVSFLVFGVMVVYGLSSLTSNFSQINQTRADAEKENIRAISSENVKKIEAIYEAALESKGHKLIQKDSSSLIGTIEDNAFNQLREFLEKTFKDDGEIIYATYFVREHNEIKAWQHLSRQFPKGLNLPIEYDRKTMAWNATTSTGKRVQIPDSEVLKIQDIDEPMVVLKKINLPDVNGNLSLTQVYDCAIPIYKRNSKPKDIVAAKKRGDAIGFLRYGLSLEKMENSIAEEKRGLATTLEKIQSESVRHSELAAQAVKALARNSFLLLGISAILVFLLAYGISWEMSKRVTRPVNELTGIAKKMAAGDYKQDIQVRTDDEIGILADTFRDMSEGITRRDEEIRRAERQLSEIFAGVPVGILSIGSGGIVGEKYSGYTEWLLNESNIAGQNLKKLLFEQSFGEMPKETQDCINGIPDIFGKSEMHYELSKLFLPSQIHYKLAANHPDKERFIDLTYQPIFQGESLSRILMVLEDRTAIVRAKQAEKEANLHSDKSVLRVMQIKKGSPENQVRLVADIDQLIRRAHDACQSHDEQQIRIVLHSIKGNARIAGFEFLTGLAHNTEMRINVLESDQKPFDWTMVSASLDEMAEEWREVSGFYQVLSSNKKTTQIPTSKSQLLSAPELAKVFGQILRKPPPITDEGALSRTRLALRSAFCSQLSLQESDIKLRISETANLQRKEISFSAEFDPKIMIDSNSEGILSECLLHLTNNSIAHGILTPDERQKQGKTPDGKILVKIFEDARGLVCETSDDGMGINVDAVKNSSIKKGLITQEAADRLTRQEGMELIFLSGVSSAKKVDTISGMGVGLDAVKERLKSVGGTITVTDSVPSGTKFVLTMPTLGCVDLGFANTTMDALDSKFRDALVALEHSEGISVSLQEPSHEEKSKMSQQKASLDLKWLSISLSTLAAAFSRTHDRVIITRDLSYEGHACYRFKSDETEENAITNIQRLNMLRDTHPSIYYAQPFCRRIIERHHGDLARKDGSLEILLPLS